jgi:hypothetical protein
MECEFVPAAVGTKKTNRIWNMGHEKALVWFQVNRAARGHRDHLDSRKPALTGIVTASGDFTGIRITSRRPSGPDCLEAQFARIAFWFLWIAPLLGPLPTPSSWKEEENLRGLGKLLCKVCANRNAPTALTRFGSFNRTDALGGRREAWLSW